MPGPLIPVVLCGGSGTRLWPLSSDATPKQFLRLVSEHSLLQETLLRLNGLPGDVAAPVVICNEAHRFLVAEQLRELSMPAARIVLEPVARNTAPAVAVAAMLARDAAPDGTDPMLLVLPADHVIRDAAAFRAVVTAGVAAAADGHLVTFGIVPDRAETGYGYIRRGAHRGAYDVVGEFVEKPDSATAERYLAAGDYLWNSGMFVFSAGTCLRELERHAPAMLEACENAVRSATADADFTRLGAAFEQCPADSLDYAVMEKTERAAVVALDAGWSDVGSWAAVHDVRSKDADGNAISGSVLAEDCSGTYIAAHHRHVAAIGLENFVVVETADHVLIVPRAQSQYVKDIADRMKR